MHWVSLLMNIKPTLPQSFRLGIDSVCTSLIQLTIPFYFSPCSYHIKWPQCVRADLVVLKHAIIDLIFSLSTQFRLEILLLFCFKCQQPCFRRRKTVSVSFINLALELLHECTMHLVKKGSSYYYTLLLS